MEQFTKRGWSKRLAIYLNPKPSCMVAAMIRAFLRTSLWPDSPVCISRTPEPAAGSAARLGRPGTCVSYH